MTEINLPRESRVGVVGSNSSTGSLTVDLVGNSRERSLNGRMVVVAPEDYDGVQEYGLGTVTEITTTNVYHEDPALRGVIAQHGQINNLTGRGDIKAAKVEVSSAFRQDGDKVRAVGGALTFAPNTGEGLFEATSDIVRSLCESANKDLFYLGKVYRQNIPMPLSFRDFSDARGAEFAGFFGSSGTGKTYCATSFFGSTMRHRDMAFLLIDPQGQFTTNSKVSRDLPFDLRALAEAQGREVEQLSVARQVRLPKDENLFCDLLKSASFFSANRLIGANNQASNARDVMEAWLESTPKWPELEPGDFLDRFLNHMVERVENDAVVVSKAPKERMVANLSAALHEEGEHGAGKRAALLRVLEPFLNMFSGHGPGGVERKSMSEIVKALCESDTGYAGNRKARPFYVLTLADQISGPQGEETEVTRALKQTKTQMVILDTLFSALEGQARWQYTSEDGSPANLFVMLDEAARFASDSTRNAEQRDMADKLGRYFRELRKYAIGFSLILQEPSALHPSIWKQLQNGFRAYAGGMVGNDLDRVREEIGSGGPLRLYQQLARPSKDHAIYPWMFCGSISPLSVTATPLFMEAFTSPEEWADANEEWLPKIFDVTDIWHKG